MLLCVYHNKSMVAVVDIRTLWKVGLKIGLDRRIVLTGVNQISLAKPGSVCVHHKRWKAESLQQDRVGGFLTDALGRESSSARSFAGGTHCTVGTS